MSNSKISALTSATTPLAGTEAVPIVQSSATKQVSVDNLTNGRTVKMSTALVGNTSLGLSNQLEVYSATYATLAAFRSVPLDGINSYLLITTSANGVTLEENGSSYKNLILKTGATNRVTVSSGGDVTVNTGNLIQGTAAKGINFTANTPAAGMTSQLLNWYEEGTWTPNQGGGLTVIGAFSSTGKYTRVGRNLTISGTVTGATSVALAAAGIITTNLPFTVSTAGHGNVTNAALTSFAAIICTSTNVTSAGAIAATGTLTFSATYFV